jgi:hypothetical protein
MRKLLALLLVYRVAVDRLTDSKHWPVRGWATSRWALAAPVATLSLTAAVVAGPDRWAWGPVARWAWQVVASPDRWAW